jgi:capsular polysaccharide biosynthesis protein
LDDFTQHVYRSLNISVSKESNNKILIIDRLHDRKLDRSIVAQLMYYGDCSIVYLEHMTFSAQVELFSKHSIFVLAHGSAEINLLFAPRHSIVFEFDSIPTRAVIYKRLCDLRGLRHVVLPYNEDLDVRAKIFDILV